MRRVVVSELTDTPAASFRPWLLRAVRQERKGQDRVRSVEAEEESLHLRLRKRTLLVLLTLPVPGHALRLVHR